MDENLKQWIDFAQSASSKKDWPEAVKRWQAVVAAFPEQTPVEVLCELAIAQRRNKDASGSESTLKYAQVQYPQNRRLMVEYAALEMYRNDWPGALAWWKKVKQAGGALPPFDYSRFLTCCRKTGHSELFENMLSESLKKFPNSKQILFQEALYLMESGSPNKAAEILRKLASGESDPKQKATYSFYELSCHIKKRALALPSEEDIVSNWSTGATEPLVSIIGIAYNHEKYIADAINGFLIQKTTFPFEIIIHDDASTDGTRKILLEYQRKYPNLIRLVLQDENVFSKGIKPLVYCQKLAKGRYVAPCECDDFWVLENKLETQLKVMESNPEVYMCHHDVIRFSEINIRSNPVLQKESVDPAVRFFETNEIFYTKKDLPRISTQMYRNIPNPHDWIQGKVLAGDQVRASIGALFGGACKLQNYHGAAWRVNDSSSWTPISEQLKIIHIYSFRAWLSVFYFRVGMPTQGLYFYNLVKNESGSIEESIRSLKDDLITCYIKYTTEVIEILKDDSFKQYIKPIPEKS